MKYLMAFVCPPIALLACEKWAQAIPAALLFALAVATARYGVGALIEFFLILWASNVVGGQQSRREARAFIKTVAPIPIVRD